MNVDVLLARVLQAAHSDACGTGFDRLPWREIVPPACEAWLGGLVLEAVERHGLQLELPELQQLRWQASQIRRGNLHILKSLARIACAYRERDVPLLLLKGAGLNLTLYDQLDRRPMSDLDLMVRPNDLARAMSTLAGLGFWPGPGFVRSDFFPRFHYAMEYRSEAPDAVRVDLHVRPFRPLKYAQTIRDGAFWHRTRVVDLEGAPVHVAADEEQFVHLATHSACHGHSRLIWLYDLCRLVDVHGSKLDWDRIVHLSRRWQLVLPVRRALHELEARWGPMAPRDIREVLNGERVGWRDRLCLAQAPHDATCPIHHVVVNLLCIRGLRLRFGYLRRVLLPDRGHMGQVYRRRHRGWYLLAHARRWLQALIRPAARSISLLRTST